MGNNDKHWIDRRHPAYSTMAEHWEFVAESYRGGPEWFNETNIPKYPNELEAKYRHRLANATRDNYTKEVVDQHTGYLFKQVPSRQGSPSLLEFWAAAKGDEGDIDDLMREVCTDSSKQGRVAIIIDKSVGQAISAAHDSKPYAYAISILDLLNYAWGPDRELLWTLTRECSLDDQDPKNSSGEAVEKFRLRTREGWELWEKRKAENGISEEYILIDQGVWGFKWGKVPVVFLDHQDSSGSRYSPPGLVDEIARIDREIAQEQTSLHEIVMAQSAPTLMMPTDEDDSSKIIKLGTAAVLTYSPEATTPPAYLTVPGDLITALQDRIDKRIAKLRELASLPTGNTAGQAAQSGVAKQWDSQALQGRLAAKAQNLQAAEMEIAQIVDLFNGGDGSREGVVIQYPSTFDVTSLADDINQAPALAEMPGQYSLTYKAQLAKSIAKKSMPDLDERTRKTIDDEIEANVMAGDRVLDEDDNNADDA